MAVDFRMRVISVRCIRAHTAVARARQCLHSAAQRLRPRLRRRYTNSMENRRHHRPGEARPHSVRLFAMSEPVGRGGKKQC